MAFEETNNEPAQEVKPATENKPKEEETAAVSGEEEETEEGDGGGKKKKKVKSERAKKWKERLAKRSKSPTPRDLGISDENGADDATTGAKSDAATAGADEAPAAFPRVLYSDGGEDVSPKEPEIGSI
jgi:hypothetical protein